MALGTGTMYYLRPDENWAYAGHVAPPSVGPGTIAATYDPDWLVDGVPGRPVRGITGWLQLTITNPSGPVDVIVLGHHNLIVPVAISGDLSATITPASTRPPHGIQLNPYVILDAPVMVDTLTLITTVTNDVPAIVGEVAAGVLREMTPLLVEDAKYLIEDFAAPARGVALSVMLYDRGLERRVLTGSQYYEGTELPDLIAWWQAQRASSRPSVLIPDPDVNDAWFVTFQGFTYEPVGPKSRDLYLVHFTFAEYARGRW